eukprot:TRINITY_DN8072_c0_g3_i1.p1 TRINITY_DN8072_c0_g3~~TRINITY_DN8072_c0_g3_i1.p1  ORF type:complete len:811 (+),score=158.54 TRINITY_DN8072_c0_g3_i1:92-2524(+)
METTIQIIEKTYEHFGTDNFKGAMEYLNKLKENQYHQARVLPKVKHNLLLADYLRERVTNLAEFLTEMEKLVREWRSRPQTVITPSGKGTGAKKIGTWDSEELVASAKLSRKDSKGKQTKLSTNSVHEESKAGSANEQSVESEDDPTSRQITIFNYAVALYLAGKPELSLEVLESLYREVGQSMCDFIRLKTIDLLIETGLAIGVSDSQLTGWLDVAKEIASRIAKTPLEQRAEAFKTSEANKSAVYSIIDKKSLRFVNSLFVGNQIYHVGTPNFVHEREAELFVSVKDLQIAIRFKKGNVVKDCFKAVKQSMANVTDITKASSETSIGYSSKTKEVLQYWLRLSYRYLKAASAYEEGAQERALKHLSKLTGIVPANSHELKDVVAFNNAIRFNNLALVHYRLEKPTLALFYAQKAFVGAVNTRDDTLKDNQRQEIAFVSSVFKGALLAKLPFTLYNYGMMLYAAKKYSEALNALSQCTTYFVGNANLWYRIGMCYVGMYNESTKKNYDQRMNNLYADLIDPNPPMIYTNDNEKEVQHCTRFVLNTRAPSTFMNDEVEQGASHESTETEDERLQHILVNAYRAMKNAYIQAYRPALNGARPRSARAEEQKSNDVSSPRLPAGDSRLLSFCLTSLAYISLCRVRYSQCVRYASEAMTLPLTEEQRCANAMYLAEAYTGLGRPEEALAALNGTKSLQGTVKSLPVRNTLGSHHNYWTDENFSLKAAFHANLAAVNIVANDLAAATQNLNQSLTSMNVIQNLISSEIPLPILNQMIYLYLRNGHTSSALQLLRRRRVLTTVSNNNRPLLKIAK